MPAFFVSTIMGQLQAPFRWRRTGQPARTSVGEEPRQRAEGAHLTTQLRCFQITNACSSWPREANVCHRVPTQGEGAICNSDTLSLTHHACFFLSNRPAALSFHQSPHLLSPQKNGTFHGFSHLTPTQKLLWKQTRLHRRDSATAELAPLLHPLVSEKTEVFINETERLVQAICTRASFTHDLAAARPCAVQPAKCYLLGGGWGGCVCTRTCVCTHTQPPSLITAVTRGQVCCSPEA